MTDIPPTASASAIRENVASGKLSALAAAEDCFRRIDAADEKIRAFISLTRESALAKAREVDEKVAAGKSVGLLAGVPVAIKDNICIRGTKTTCASRILENFEAPYDAFVIKRILEEDGVIVGKTNMDEFAMGSSCENSAFFPTHNPWNLEYIPGGSSGGSGAAVAARMVPLALGSDTGGSIRLPASMCGVTGLKATYGRVSRYGLVAFGSSLDQIGPFAANAADCALLLRAISGKDRSDSTSADMPVADFPAMIEGDIKGRKLGVPKEYFVADIDKDIEAAVRKAIDTLASLGAEIVEISLPHTPYSNAAYYIVATAEASSNLARYDGVHYGHRSKDAGDMFELYATTRDEGFGAEVKRRILLGTYVLSAGYYEQYYLRALKTRTLIRRDFDEAFKKVDAIVCPTMPVAPFRLGERIDDPLQMYYCDILTTATNLAGLPAVSIPCGFTGEPPAASDRTSDPQSDSPAAKKRNTTGSRPRLPIGFQIMGRPFDEAGILRIARAFEEATDFHRQLPPAGT
ncbi:MAG: Asp-tRNA(Asn)/Glu-tRNA(Gln) amidotransferase subunit GatA [Planctomycetota bacterium]